MYCGYCIVHLWNSLSLIFFPYLPIIWYLQIFGFVTLETETKLRLNQTFVFVFVALVKVCKHVDNTFKILNICWLAGMITMVTCHEKSCFFR